MTIRNREWKRNEWGICEGHCFSGDGGGTRCKVIDPKTGYQCSLKNTHLEPDKYEGQDYLLNTHSPQHISCSHHNKGSHRNIINAIWISCIVKTRSPRIIRAF